MRIDWIIDDDDISRVKEFFNRHQDNPFVRSRIKCNLRPDKPGCERLPNCASGKSWRAYDARPHPVVPPDSPPPFANSCANHAYGCPITTIARTGRAPTSVSPAATATLVARSEPKASAMRVCPVYRGRFRHRCLFSLIGLFSS